METTRNPGMLAVVVGVGLGVLFALLGFTGVIDTRVGLGLALISIMVPALLYLFYMRGTAISRMGYASVIAILATALIIPLLTITQQQDQSSQTSTQYQLTLQRGAAIFGQYCAPCHGYQGQGIIGPQLNGIGSGVPAVNTLTDQEITRTISGGVPDPTQINTYLMPAWLDAYGGPLTEEDISYLLSLIRSSEPAYRQANNLPDTNGFDYVYASLSSTQQPTASAQAAAPTKPAASTFQDLTGQKAVTVAALDDTGSTTNYHWSVNGGTSNIIISAGTTVTWVNHSSIPHNVYSGYGKFEAVPAPDGFKSDILNPNAESFTFTYQSAGEYPYFCDIHPYMVGWITVK